MAYKNNPYLHERVLLSLDLETIPVQDSALLANLIADGIAGVKMPGSISKLETKEAWERDIKPVKIEEAIAAATETYARGGLSPLTGRIVCIGMVHGEHEKVFCGDDEAELLHLAYEYISTLGEPITYIGSNIVGFDLPFLRVRSIVHRRTAPLSLRKAWSAKSWDQEHVGDTTLAWGNDREKRVGLDRLCRLLGIPSPKEDGVDGSQVYALWQAGELGKISDYCLRDCRAALACYQRIVEVA
jgi:3'-5' exonuclease